MSQTQSQSTQSSFTIELGEEEHLLPLSHLLNEHRVSQGLPSDLPAVSHFLFERLINHESVIFVALDKTVPEPQLQGKGFVQMYSTFSSQTLQPVWILGELYVIPTHRRQGIAQSLIQQALTLIQQRGDQGLQLDIPTENTVARQFLERMGFRLNPSVAHYTLNCIQPKQ